MSRIEEVTRDRWILDTFPEWGTWLNEEIEEQKVEEGSVAMWWMGCTGVWIKTPGDCNISIDLWCGRGKRTKRVKEMALGHQMANMSGGRKLRTEPESVCGCTGSICGKKSRCCTGNTLPSGSYGCELCRGSYSRMFRNPSLLLVPKRQ